MANIAILNYCNLQCPYCFANKFITEEEKVLITDGQLDRILEFLDKSLPDSRIGIIGGEPTIHPNFRQIALKIAQFSEEHHFTPPVLFTNGIKLGEFAELFPMINALINVNDPNIIGETNWEELNKSLKRIDARNCLDHITLGINLYPGMPDFNYILDLAQKYRRTEVRCSYVAPTCHFSDVDKDKYYTEAKPLFLDFVKAASDRKILVNIDCNHIPECYFSEQELLYLEDKITGLRSVCEPVIDISPDMKATACFGAYHLIDATKFDNEMDLAHYLELKEMYARVLKNGTGKCETCAKYENLSCQGGCLAFANIDKENNE